MAFLPTVQARPGLGALVGAGLGHGVQQGVSSGSDYAMQLGLQKAKMMQNLQMAQKMGLLSEVSQQALSAQIAPKQPNLAEGLFPSEQPGQQESTEQQQVQMPSQEMDSGKIYQKADFFDIIGQHGIAQGLRERAKTQTKDVNESWNRHQKYIDDQSDKYREGQTILSKLKMQKDLVATGKLISPPLAALAEAIGADPLIYNEPTQLYSKIQSDLAGGFTKWIGTARTSLPEFNIFLKRFATLRNSDAGKNLILDFQMTEQKLKNAESRITQELTDQYSRSGVALPKNFRNIVNKMVDNEYEKGGLELKNLMERSKKIEKNQMGIMVEKGSVLMRDPAGNPRSVPKKDVKSAMDAGYVVE